MAVAACRACSTAGPAAPPAVAAVLTEVADGRACCIAGLADPLVPGTGGFSVPGRGMSLTYDIVDRVEFKAGDLDSKRKVF